MRGAIAVGGGRYRGGHHAQPTRLQQQRVPGGWGAGELSFCREIREEIFGKDRAGNA